MKSRRKLYLDFNSLFRPEIDYTNRIEHILTKFKKKKLLKPVFIYLFFFKYTDNCIGQNPTSENNLMEAIFQFFSISTIVAQTIFLKFLFINVHFIGLSLLFEFIFIHGPEILCFPLICLIRRIYCFANKIKTVR